MHLTAADWARIETLFPLAAELSGEARVRFLDRECAGNERVRRELEAMLAAEATQDSLFDAPITLTSTENRPAIEGLAAGTRLGSWKIRLLIGTGGMGEVYLAERADGAYAMTAAIKLLKRELYSYANAQRFLRERRVLARLSHPNIARVLDAGTTDDGRPFLVMEYAPGARITDHARERMLAPRQIAQLMVAVAEAVAEAHRHGVVHRDLKPANVIVTDPQQVKLLDFGIARLLDENDADTSSAVPMTPAYAAPEQILNGELTPATDVYALGVMLFQLLTHTLPHLREGLPLPVIAAGLRDEAVERPSRVVLAGEGPFYAEARQKRAQEIEGELDRIVLKALHADPRQRHADAAEFADDLRRCLEGGSERKYWAFISYSHQDEAWAQWLHKSIETWRVPGRLVGRPLGDETVPRRLFPVFRDRDELPSSHELGAVINQALRQSRNLIVVCSPRSATSRWVNEEIKAFRALGRSHRVFCLIVDGEPHASAKPEIAFSECFPPALREEGFEPIAADARERKDSKAGARLKLLAGLLDVGLDELRQRERQRAFRERLVRTGLALAVVAALAGTAQWFLSQRAEREHQIMLDRLEEAGRLELLDGRQARAAVLLHEALRLGRDTVPLRFMLGQAMLPVDALSNVRVRHGGQTVRRAIFSPDGKQFVLIVAAADGVVAKVYDAATGAERIVLKQVPAYPRIVQFIGDGARLLVSGFAEQGATDEAGPSIAVWSLDRPEPLFTREGYTGRAGSPVGPDGSLALGTAAGLLVLDGSTGAQRRLIDSGRVFTALSHSTDGRWLATADQAGRVELRSTGDYRAARALNGFEGQSIVGLSFTPDHKRLLGLSRYGDVRIWDVERGALVVAFGADAAWVSSLMFSADGRRLLTVGSEGFKVWSAARGALLFDVRNAIYRDASAVLSADGDYLYVADDTSSVAEIWGVRSSTRLQTLDLHTNSVSAIALDARGERLVLASKDGTAAIWRARIAPAVRLDIGTTAPSRVLWSGNDDRLVVVGEQGGRGVVATLDASTGTVLSSGEGHRSFVPVAALSADRRRLLTAGNDGIVGIWNTESNVASALVDLKLHFNEAGLTPDGSRGALLGVPEMNKRGPAGFLIDGHSGDAIAPLEGHGPLRALAISPDGALVAATDEGGSVRVWRTSNGELLTSFAAHAGIAESVAFDVSGTRIVTGGRDNAVRVWAVPDGTKLAELVDAGLGWVFRARFARNGTRIAIGTGSGDVWLWNPAEGAATPEKGHRSGVTSLSFVHDGRILVTAGFDGLVRAWDVDSGRALALIAALGGAVYALDYPRDEAHLVASSPVTRLGGIWSTRLEQRPLEVLESTLRCRTPWRIAGSELIQSANVADGCS